MPDFTRRSFLLGGCALVGAAAVSMTLFSGDAEASVLTATPAPRHHCPHDGCRHWRPGDDGGTGICGLSLQGTVLPIPEVYP